MIWTLNELIQANEKVFMNFWYIKDYGARRVEDDFVANNN